MRKPSRGISRWKAAAIHLCLSAMLGLMGGALIFGLWYPPPFFHAAGADELILLLIGVDLVVGPLLTLVVFRQGKPGLRFDLVTIGALQSVALVYGMSVVLQARPIFLVAAVDRLVLVSANEISDADLALGSQPRFRTRSWSGPRLLAARMPSDPTERSDLAFAALHGRDLQNQPRYYTDYSEGGRSLLPRAKPLGQLFATKPETQHIVNEWLRRSGHSSDTVLWVPLQAPKADLVMLLNAQTASPLHAFAIDPW